MGNFRKAVDYVIYNETSGRADGAYTNDPDDSGGATKWGITESEARKHGFMDVRALTREQAVDIYRSDYWPYFEFVHNDQVATKLFDIYVNMGAAITVIQRALRQSGRDVAVDGIWGPKTLAAVNACDPDILLHELTYAAHEQYARIVEKKPSQAKYLNGWLARANRVPDVSGGLPGRPLPAPKVVRNV